MIRQYSFSADEIETLKNSVPLSGIIGQAIQLKQRGQHHVGLCPFHTERTPSFTITDARGIFYCFGCETSGDAITWMTEYHGMSFGEATSYLAELAGLHLRGPVPRKPARGFKEQRLKQNADHGDQRKAKLAARIWNEALPIAGTLAERYLRCRELTLELPTCLRFHPACKHAPSGQTLPAMIAAVIGADGRVIAVHRTYLRECEDGRVVKAQVEPAKMMLGSTMGSACRLAPAAEVMALGTGIETSLSFQQLLGLPTWAALSDCGLEKVILPSLPLGAEVVIAADLDPGGQGETAAFRAADRFTAQGRKVKVVLPPSQNGENKLDFNDLIQMVAQEAVQ